MARWIVGVDGCKGGWVAAFRDLDEPSLVRIRVETSFAVLVDASEEPAVIAVDMPIGLPARIFGQGRPPEQAVRPLLGKRRSAVFAIPSRSAVYSEIGPFRNEQDRYAAHQRMCAVARQTSEPPSGASIQAFGIFPRIREIDALLLGRPHLQERVFEVHPEVAFWSMNGERPLTAAKKSAFGRAHRRQLLIAAGFAPSLVDAIPPKGAAADDYLDALGALVVAHRLHAGEGRPFPDPPGRDERGLPVAIWSFRRDCDRSTGAMPITRDTIAAAHARIASHIRRTPVLDLPRGAFGLDHRLSLKLEFLQHAGSFKPRGAFNTLLSQPIPVAGVAAASGGNHGAAVAYAASTLGLKARIFVPEIASPAKIAAIRAFGAEIEIGGARYADAQEACDRFVAETGALRVHPFDAEATIAGQGTVALEWQEQAELDTVLVAVGGGGLVAGMAAWWHGAPVKVVGVEPEGSRALHAALEAGGPVDVPVESVAADSLGARNVGTLVHAIAAAAVDHVALVSDDAIVAAQRALWRECRIAAEPGGAAALATLLSGVYKPARGERVGVLLCGGNVDLAALDRISC